MKVAHNVEYVKNLSSDDRFISCLDKWVGLLNVNIVDRIEFDVNFPLGHSQVVIKKSDDERNIEFHLSNLKYKKAKNGCKGRIENNLFLLQESNFKNWVEKIFLFRLLDRSEIRRFLISFECGFGKDIGGIEFIRDRYDY